MTENGNSISGSLIFENAVIREIVERGIMRASNLRESSMLRNLKGKRVVSQTRAHRKNETGA